MIRRLEEFKVYELSMSLADEIWKTVSRWNYFERDTPGKQFVRVADPMGANLSEGLGRYHFKDIKNFGYFSRGSLFETKTWIMKSYSRKLINEEEYLRLTTEIDSVGKMPNSYIKSAGTLESISPKP